MAKIENSFNKLAALLSKEIGNLKIDKENEICFGKRILNEIFPVNICSGIRKKWIFLDSWILEPKIPIEKFNEFIQAFSIINVSVAFNGSYIANPDYFMGFRSFDSTKFVDDLLIDSLKEQEKRIIWLPNLYNEIMERKKMPYEAVKESINNLNKVEPKMFHTEKILLVEQNDEIPIFN